MKIYKPQNIEDYKKWLSDNHKIELCDRDKNHYGSVVSKIKSDFEVSDFWRSTKDKLRMLNQSYYLKTGYYLFINENIPTIVQKQYESFLLKSFRKNILTNERWPEAPSDGWVLPSNWFCRTNDIVRTYFVTKYLDGVEYLSGELLNIASSLNMETKLDYEAKDDGYYAAHCYLYFECEIPTQTWETERILVPVEIQITTQLQEVIKTLLHTYYEDKRAKPSVPDIKWQWDYRSDEFSANYLGHILHYVEGMIMEVRDKKGTGG